MEGQFYQLSPEVVMECFDDGALILNLKDLTLTELNTTARDILMKSDGNIGVVEVARQLAMEYEIDAESALKDVLDLYQQLISQGVVEASQSLGRSE